MKGSSKRVFLFSFLCVSLLVNTFVFGNEVKKRRHRRNPTAVNKSFSSQQGSDSKFSGSFKFGIKGATVEDEISQGTATSLSAKMKLNYQLASSVLLYAEPRIAFKSGFAQSLYGEFEPKNSYGVNEAKINIAPHRFFEVNAGILGHHFKKRIGNPYLINKSPFPGIEGIIHVLNFNGLKADLILEEAIPTSYTMDSGVTEMEETPRFHAQGIKLSYGDSRQDMLSGSMNLTRYEYENLPSIVAQRSRTRGNTVTDGYNFDYEYKGYSVSGNAKFNPSNTYYIGGYANYLKNTEAPDGLNKGYSFAGIAGYHFGDALSLKGTLEKFYNEADSSPGYYSLHHYGTHNRQGFIYKADLEFTNLNFKISFKYMDSDLIYETSLMAKRSMYEVKLETLDVEF